MSGKKPAAEVVKEYVTENAHAGGKSKADPTLEGSEKENLKLFTFLKWSLFAMVVFFFFMLVGTLVVTLAGKSAQSRIKSVHSEGLDVTADLVKMIADATGSLELLKTSLSSTGLQGMILEKLKLRDEYNTYLQDKNELVQLKSKAMENLKIIQESGIDRAYFNGSGLVGPRKPDVAGDYVGKYPLDAYYPAYQASYYGKGCHIAECNFPNGDNQFLEPKPIEECMRICAALRKVPAGTTEYGFTYEFKEGTECFCKKTGGKASFTEKNDGQLVYYRFN